MKWRRKEKAGGRAGKREGGRAYLPVLLGHAARREDFVGGNEFVMSSILGGGGQEVGGCGGREGGEEGGREGG